MIPKKEQLRVVNKFFDEFEKLSNKIEASKGTGNEYELLQRYMNMMDIWMMMDDYMEAIDIRIDTALHEKPEIFDKYRKT